MHIVFYRRKARLRGLQSLFEITQPVNGRAALESKSWLPIFSPESEFDSRQPKADFRKSLSGKKTYKF